MPPYLAGRQTELNSFVRLLDQSPILVNLVLTGLRGVGKTVLLETFRPIAHQHRWHWVGADLSESSTISEQALAQRILTDLSVATSAFSLEVIHGPSLFNQIPRKESVHLTYACLLDVYNATPGLVSDKIKAVLQLVAKTLPVDSKGIIFAYDEAQNLLDHSVKDQYPLSVLLEVFQSVQRQGLPLLLILTGLPTLFPKLVEARTYSERMFTVMFLERLNESDSREAIIRPIKDARCPVQFKDASVDTIVRVSGGYPYFIQFICRELYDLYLQQADRGAIEYAVPVDAITRKLDSDFFAGRWARATDRQRQLLWVISQLDNCDAEFTVQEVVEQSKATPGIKKFSSSHVNQMLVTLAEAGLIYKNRHGKYSFAVPLLGEFIGRQELT